MARVLFFSLCVLIHLSARDYSHTAKILSGKPQAVLCFQHTNKDSMCTCRIFDWNCLVFLCDSYFFFFILSSLVPSVLHALCRLPQAICKGSF